MPKVVDQAKHRRKHKLVSDQKVIRWMNKIIYSMVVGKHLHNRAHTVAKVNLKSMEILSKSKLVVHLVQ